MEPNSAMDVISAEVADFAPKLRLSDGNLIPIIGLGTWKSANSDVGQVVMDAIDVGYRHFDCAHLYGNEAEIGEALKVKMSEGLVKREDLFVTSKLWNTQHRPDLVVPAIKKSLAAFQLDYLDLYLIHFPMAYKEGDETFPTDDKGKTLYSDVDYVDTWKEMEECVKLGLTKSIGISNFNSVQVQRVLEIAKVKPVVNQVECHPYLPQKKLVEFCEANGIVVTGYSPLGSNDRPWAKPGDVKLLEDPKVQTLAEKYCKTPAQILLRWMVQRGIVTVPKSERKARLIENISIFDFTLIPEDMETLSSMERTDGRYLNVDWVADHKDYPFSIEF